MCVWKIVCACVLEWGKAVCLFCKVYLSIKKNKHVSNQPGSGGTAVMQDHRTRRIWEAAGASCLHPISSVQPLCTKHDLHVIFVFVFFPRRLTPEHHRSSANPIECLDACAVVSTFFSPHFNYHQTPFYRHQAYILTTVMTYFYQNADESKFIFYSHHWTMSYRGEGMPCCEVSFVKYLCTLALGVCGFQKGLFVTRRFHISTYLIIQKVQNQKEIVLGVGEGGGGKLQGQLPLNLHFTTTKLKI